MKLLNPVDLVIAWYDRRLARASLSLEYSMIHLIGLCLVEWSCAEQALHDIIQVIHEKGGTAIQADLPISLKTKIAYGRKAVRLELIPPDLSPEFTNLLAAFEANRGLRHDLAHGFVFFDARAEEWVICRTQYRGPNAELEEKSYDQKSLVAAMSAFRKMQVASEDLRELVWAREGIESISIRARGHGK